MLIGARTGAWSGGAKPWTNPYITDGLFLQWDGEWNAGGGQHDSTSRLVDLAGNGRDAVLPDSASIGSNYAHFTTREGVRLPRRSGDLEALSSGYTMEVCFGFDGAVSYNSYFLSFGSSSCIKNYPSSGGDVWKIPQFLAQNAWGGVGTSASTNGSRLFAEGGKYQLSMSVDIENKNTVFYQNGKRHTSASGGGIVGNQYPNFVGYGLNGSSDTRNPLLGFENIKYYSAIIYNRALTAEEIAHNYAVDKERFGIG